ncbi:MAG: hypothetical protein BWZ07_00183 [Alphaproteobacteria bacterium ADurb.BinA280]|nr:MAG: hypothetical protein BWZ07_00183 [Alphaproteobacteria bacterium ADurb.BinA280]
MPLVQHADRTHHLGWRKWQRSQHRGRRDGAIIEGVFQACAARRVAAEVSRATVVVLRNVSRPITRGKPPDVTAIAFETLRIGNGIGTLRQGRAPAVFEVVDTLGAHVLILDAPKVDPDMAVLMSEHGAKSKMLLSVVAPPALRILALPLRPCLFADGMRGRTQRQYVNQHTFVVAHPVVADEAAFGMPAHRQQGWTHLQESPVHTLINGFGQVANRLLFGLVLIEPSLCKQHTAKQERGVDG